MIEDTLLVGLVVECLAPTSRWGEPIWRPTAVLEMPPATEPWTPLGGTDAARQYYAGVVAISLYSTETANYLSNLAAGPRLWVVLRPRGLEPPVEVVTITADPAEGEAFTETGVDVVETIEMPMAIARAVAAFAERHHVERPFLKRRRDSREMDAIGKKED